MNLLLHRRFVRLSDPRERRSPRRVGGFGFAARGCGGRSAISRSLAP
jgi:hypothetical protein